MGADIPNAQPMRNAYLSLNVETDADAERGAGNQRELNLPYETQRTQSFFFGSKLSG